MTFQQVGAVTAKTVNRWAWWQKALANPKEIGKSLLASPDDPQQGYFRTRFKDKPWEPVAIFYPDGSDQIVAYRGGREVDAAEVWNWCCRHPITYEEYQRVIDGQGWSDADPTVAAQIAPAPPGHNSGDVSEAEQLRDQIEAALKGADVYREIVDDETLGRAQSLRYRLNELSRDADKRRDSLKRPHLEAGKAIDETWQPLVKSAKAGADAIGKAMSLWETAKLRRQRELEKQAEDERRKAEAIGQPAAAEPAPAPAPVAPTAIRGSYGRAASVKARTVVTGIANPIEFFKFVAADPRVEALLMKLAQEAVDAGRTVPGVLLEEQAKVI